MIICFNVNYHIEIHKWFLHIRMLSGNKICEKVLMTNYGIKCYFCLMSIETVICHSEETLFACVKCSHRIPWADLVQPETIGSNTNSP